MTWKGDSTHVLITAEDDSSKRLDIFLAENTEFSRSFCQKLIAEEQVTIAKKVVTKASYALSDGQEIVLAVPPPKLLNIIAEDIPLEIMYEDADVVVVNKKPGMVVHPDETHSTGTLVNALLFYLGAEKLSGIGGVRRPGIVHRLDKDTSGVMIVAKHDRAHRLLSEQIAARKCTKIYKTLVFGKVAHQEFSVDSPIGRDPEDGKKMRISGAAAAKSALTHFTLEHFYLTPISSYLKAQIVTGRTHQIRVHLSSIGFPVVGDPPYGNEKLNAKFFKEFPLQRIFLHAESLEIVLPNGKKRKFSAPMPLDLVKTLEALEY